MKTCAKWLDRVSGLGCIICGMPSEIHHVRLGSGLGRKTPDTLAIPLCARHHRTGGLGEAFHAGRRTWEEKFGSQVDLLEETYRRLGEPWPPADLIKILDNQRVGSRLAFRR